MREYPHIDTIWKRDMESMPKGRIRPGDFSCPEFAYLANNEWVGTEKVDGTNIRVMWDGVELTFGGKTDNAQMYPRLVTRLHELFTPVGMDAKFGGPVCLYGEGFGAGIQAGGKYNSTGAVDFALFDVKIDEWWLKRDAVEEIGQHFGLTIVPIVFRGDLYAACEWVKARTKSVWGDFVAEGLVLNPEMPLLKRNGQRVIAKIKAEDYSKLGR